jgi:hypothetical protein
MATLLSWNKLISLGRRERIPPPMEENAVNVAPLFHPDSEDECEEYLGLTDDVEMDNNERSTSRDRARDVTPVPLSLPSSLLSENRDPLVDLPLEIRPPPRRASNTQEHRHDMGIVDNNGTSGITLAPQQNTGGSAGTVVLFHHNPDSPLFQVGDKRPAQAENDEHRKQKYERRKNRMHISVRTIQLRDNFVC